MKKKNLIICLSVFIICILLLLLWQKQKKYNLVYMLYKHQFDLITFRHQYYLKKVQQKDFTRLTSVLNMWLYSSKLMEGMLLNEGKGVTLLIQYDTKAISLLLYGKNLKKIISLDSKEIIFNNYKINIFSKGSHIKYTVTDLKSNNEVNKLTIDLSSNQKVFSNTSGNNYLLIDAISHVSLKNTLPEHAKKEGVKIKKNKLIDCE